METRILIIEDDPEISDLVGMHLGDLGYRIERAATGDAGFSKAREDGFDLIILDLMLPGMDGLEICRRLQESGPRVPILMLTARTEEIDKVLGLELGADDYLTKPFSIRELIARVKALLRRTQGLAASGADEGQPAELTYDRLSINLEKRRVTLGGSPVELTAKEFDLLALFATHPGKPFKREQLLNQVWGYSFAGYEHTVNSHINRLRAKIEPDPSKPTFIRTVWGFGYRFADNEELAP
jgi:DNA-binding response OmpR family regulator